MAMRRSRLRPRKPPEVVRILGTAVIFFALEAIRPNDWVSGAAELPIFLVEVLVGMYVVDGLWTLFRGRQQEEPESGDQDLD